MDSIEQRKQVPLITLLIIVYRNYWDGGVQSVDDLGGGFWPSAKFLMLRRRNKGKITDAPTKNNDDAHVSKEIRSIIDYQL